jgi:Domain of unknown function (DUF4826)
MNSDYGTAAMPNEDFNEPAVVDRWLSDAAIKVAAYLKRESVEFNGLPSPRWNVAPVVSLWSVPSRIESTGAVWVIFGDLPTDWTNGEANELPREVMQRFAIRFQQAARMMLLGKTHPTLRIGDIADKLQQKELGQLLEKRATLLLDWAKRNDMW